MATTNTAAASNWTSPYAAEFKKLQPDHDPRHIEAYVRIECGNGLGHLTARKLASEARIAALCITEGGLDAAEDLARSYGL